MKRIHPFFLLFLVFIPIILIYFQSLTYYFLQDDWNILKKIRQEDLISFFNPKTDVIYYRPIGMQIFFFISEALFGLKPLVYHLVAFLFHLLNITLIFYLLLKLFKNKVSAALGAFVYGTASLHFMTLSWLALSWNIFGAFFIFCALICYINLFDSKSFIHQFLVLVLFLLALLSTEFAIIFPFFLVIFTFFFLKKDICEILKKRSILIGVTTIISVAYLFLRFFLFPIPAVGEYHIELNIKAIKTFIWYFLWLFNIPEDFKYQTAISHLKLSSILLRGGTSFSLPTIVSSILTLCLFIALVYRSKIEKSFLLGAILVFLLFLLPVLFLPAHTYPYYLTFPVFGLILLLSKLALTLQGNKWGILLLTAFIFSWFYSSFLSVSFSRQTHWIPMEQGLAKEAIGKINKELPVSPASNSKITFVTNNRMLKSALFDQDALQVLFKNNSIKTIYHNNSETVLEKTDYLVNF